MKNDFLTFERFDHEHAALQMAALLTESNIPFELEDNTAPFDPSFRPGGSEKSFALKLKKEDFERAHLIIEEAAAAEAEFIDPDYYLLTFTDAELRDVVIARDEWNPFDVMLAQKLLKERGMELGTEEIRQMKAQRLLELSKPEKDQSLYILMGYLFAVLGGALGFFIGWHLQSHRKTLPNGDRVHAHSAANRRSGKKIVIVGIMSVIVWSICYYITYLRVAE